MAMAPQQQTRAHATLTGLGYLFLAQTVKQGFLLHPKANIDQGTGFPRAEGSQAGRETAETLVRETEGKKVEASFSSPTHHGGEKKESTDGHPQPKGWCLSSRKLVQWRLFPPSCIAISDVLMAKQGATTHCHRNLKEIVYCQRSGAHKGPTG